MVVNSEVAIAAVVPTSLWTSVGVPVSHIVDEGHSDQCEQGLEAAWEGGDRGEQGGRRPWWSWLASW